MARYKKDNSFAFRKPECTLCGEQSTLRKTEAIYPSEKERGKYVLATNEHGEPITRARLPRQHRKGEGCRRS